MIFDIFIIMTHAPRQLKRYAKKTRRVQKDEKILNFGRQLEARVYNKMFIFKCGY